MGTEQRPTTGQPGETPGTTTNAGETPATTTQGETPTNPNPPTGGETPPWGSDFNPERAWNTIQRLRKYEDDYNALKRQVDADEAAKKEADEAALAEQERWKELAESRATEIADLKPKAEAVDRYREVLEKHVATLIDGLPAHVTELLTRMDVVDQLDYLTKHGETLRTPVAEGVPDTPRGNSSGETSADLADDYIKRTYGKKPQTT